MNLTITDPKTKEKLVLSEFKADLGSGFDRSLGVCPCGSRYYCGDDKPKTWPIKFSLFASGILDSTKEGRLRVTVTGDHVLAKGKAPENKDGFRIRLVREATGQEIGGFTAQDRIGAMVREKAASLTAPAKVAMRAAVEAIWKDEQKKIEGHIQRRKTVAIVMMGIKK